MSLFPYIVLHRNTAERPHSVPDIHLKLLLLLWDNTFILKAESCWIFSKLENSFEVQSLRALSLNEGEEHCSHKGCSEDTARHQVELCWMWCFAEKGRCCTGTAEAAACSWLQQLPRWHTAMWSSRELRVAVRLSWFSSANDTSFQGSSSHTSFLPCALYTGEGKRGYTRSHLQ